MPTTSIPADRVRQRLGALLVVLTAVAGSTDAISYLGLGQVFPANMTGNTVLLGIGVAGGDYARAGRSAVALGVFVLAAAGAGMVHVGQPADRVIGRGLAVELAALAAMLGWWLSVGDHPGGAARYGLIGLVGAAMGVQSATVTRLDVGVSTTFITGTWTAVSRRAGSWLRHRPSRAPASQVLPPAPEETTTRQALVLIVYFCAALGSGFARRDAGAVAAVIPVGLLIIACLATGSASPRRRR